MSSRKAISKKRWNGSLASVRTGCGRSLFGAACGRRVDETTDDDDVVWAAAEVVGSGSEQVGIRGGIK